MRITHILTLAILHVPLPLPHTHTHSIEERLRRSLSACGIYRSRSLLMFLVVVGGGSVWEVVVVGVG